MTAATCDICHEPAEHVDGRWIHPHSGDAECWTGDGSVAAPAPVMAGNGQTLAAVLREAMEKNGEFV